VFIQHRDPGLEHPNGRDGVVPITRAEPRVRHFGQVGVAARRASSLSATSFSAVLERVGRELDGAGPLALVLVETVRTVNLSVFGVIRVGRQHSGPLCKSDDPAV
jgi:hypothetical protein